MAKFLFLFFTLCVLQVSLSARVARDAPAETSSSVLDDLSKQASDWLQTLGNQWTETVEAKDLTEVQAIVKKNTDSLTTQLTDLVTGLNSKISEASSDQSTVLGQVVSKLNQTIADLQKANPETADLAKKTNENFQKSLETVAAEFDKVKKTFGENTKGIQGDLEKLTKQAYDGIVKSAQTVQQQIKAASDKQ